METTPQQRLLRCITQYALVHIEGDKEQDNGYSGIFTTT
jgi:hypothetical protein